MTRRNRHVLSALLCAIVSACIPPETKGLDARLPIIYDVTNYLAWRRVGDEQTHNPVQLYCLLEKVKSLSCDQRVVVLSAMRGWPGNLCQIVVVSLFEGDDGMPSLFGGYEDVQETVRSVIPSFPIIWIGGLPYYVSPQRILPRAVGGATPWESFEKFIEWSAHAKMRELPHVEGSPLLAVDSLKDSKTIAEVLGALGPTAGDAEDLMSVLRLQARSCIEGALAAAVDGEKSEGEVAGGVVGAMDWGHLIELVKYYDTRWDDSSCQFVVDRLVLPLEEDK